MALVNGATYRLQCRADSSRSLNVYGTTPTSLAMYAFIRIMTMIFASSGFTRSPAAENILSARATRTWLWTCILVLLRLRM